MTIKATVGSLFLIVTFYSVLSFGQDIIYLKDRAEIVAIILDAGSDQIRYLKYSNPDGPEYMIDKLQVFKIVYENGETTFYRVSEKKDKISNMNLNNNILWYHIFDVVYHDFTLSFEKIFAKGTLGIQILLGVGYGPNEFQYSVAYNIVYSGIGLNLYPQGQGKVRYFLGPVIHIGIAGDYDVVFYDTPYMYHETLKSKTTYGKILINNGLIFSPTDNYSTSAVFGLGCKYFDGKLSWHKTGITRSAWFSIRMGYRF